MTTTVQYNTTVDLPSTPRTIWYPRAYSRASIWRVGAPFFTLVFFMTLVGEGDAGEGDAARGVRRGFDEARRASLGEPPARACMALVFDTRDSLNTILTMEYVPTEK